MPPKGAPNILLIMTDDVGFSAPSTFGGVIPTPALDRIGNDEFVGEIALPTVPFRVGVSGIDADGGRYQRLTGRMFRGETVEVFGVAVSFLTLDGLSHMLLPALNLALFKTSLVIRLARAGTREAVLQDYVKFARAKGLSPRRIVLVHIAKNIMIPVVTVLGLELGSMIAFAVVTESVFAWPGMGKLLIDSILLLDRPVVVAYLIVIVLTFLLINFVVDALYSALDPRVRLRDAGS